MLGPVQHYQCTVKVYWTSPLAIKGPTTCACSWSSLAVSKVSHRNHESGIENHTLVGSVAQALPVIHVY